MQGIYFGMRTLVSGDQMLPAFMHEVDQAQETVGEAVQIHYRFVRN
jgi:hypothetical protein